jgi:DNA-binding phage protein
MRGQDRNFARWWNQETPEQGYRNRAFPMERLQGAAPKRRGMMALTKSFKETVRARAQRNPKFRVALIREALEKLVNGDVESGLSILGDYVNATVGYKTLAERTGKNPKSLMRMLGPAGNPTAENLFSVIKQLKEQEGLEFDIRARHA